MPRITVGTENDAPIELHYEDHGSGQAVVLIHGYPLNGNSWERQERELLSAGFRCISYDRRGFGRSSQPTVGTTTTPSRPTSTRCSSTSTCATSCCAAFRWAPARSRATSAPTAPARISKAALLGAIPPFVRKTEDNPEGVDGQVFEGIKAAIANDRYAFFKNFLDNFNNVDVLGPDRISDQAWQAMLQRRGGLVALCDLRLRGHMAHRLP